LYGNYTTATDTRIHCAYLVC